jgi:hypothetical protein
MPKVMNSGIRTKFSFELRPPSTDKWLMGFSLDELAPTVVAAVPLRTRSRCTVADALQEHNWASDIRSGLSMICLFE